MSSFTVENILYKVAHNPSFQAEYRQNPEAVLDRYSLTERERADLLAWNVRSLADGGASAMLVMLGYMSFHGPKQKDYIQAMKRTAAPSATA